MLRSIILIAVFSLSVLATENPGEAAINNALVQTEHLNSVQENMKNLLNNSYLKMFYDQYYKRPQDTLAGQIRDASERIETNTKMSTGHYYPYANQISIDPNVMHRLVNIQPRRALVNRISDLDTKNLKYDSDRAAAEKLYSEAYANRGKNTAEVRSRVNSIEDNLYQSKLLSAHKHDYSRPFADGANMEKLLQTVRKMEKVVRAPLTPNLPNAEEIHAMNRLSEKLGMISKRVHQKPTEELHQQAHAQDVMLDRAANLIRRLSNSVDATKRDHFLNAVHQELHKHHLHDHKFLNNLESEIGFAIANGTPLQMPRESEYTNANVEPTVSVQHTPETRFDLNTAVTGNLPKTQNTIVTVNGGTQAQAQAQTVQPTAQTQNRANMNDPEYARQVAASMDKYGREVLARSREMEHRADLYQHNNAVTTAQRRELEQHMQHRLVNPPAQVHSIGANRPVVY